MLFVVIFFYVAIDVVVVVVVFDDDDIVVLDDVVAAIVHPNDLPLSSNSWDIDVVIVSLVIVVVDPKNFRVWSKSGQ